MLDYTLQIKNILDFGKVELSTILPSDWAEQNIIMGKPFPGPFRYNRTPYTRELVDFFAEDNPSRVLSVMKGAQIGFSAGVIYPAIGYIISQNPGNSYLSVGHDDLIDEAMNKIDQLINNAGIRSLIKASVQRTRNTKSGDTNKKKEFSGGYLVVGSANNHKILRQRDLQYGLIDDYESVKQNSKESGSTLKMIEQRFAAYADKKKLAFISTPELEQTSNILEVYLLGDQRKYMVPCPCCGDYIELKWTHETEEGKQAGITYKLDSDNKVDTYGYTCQSCYGFFEEKHKEDILLKGYWKPTTEPQIDGYVSYHISSLYAPPGMDTWKKYINDYLQATKGNEIDDKKYQTFTNLALGLPYKKEATNIKANELQMNNVRDYPIREVPESLSNYDGNGDIVLLTCSADMNGLADDSRLDYEVVAWTENGSSYSILHGSIGTFVPRENSERNKEGRYKWTYELNKENSVWGEFEKVLNQVYYTDKKEPLKIAIAGLDTGHYTNYAYTFLDLTRCRVVGLKGDKENVQRKYSLDTPYFKNARERSNLYILDVSIIKDLVAQNMKLKCYENEKQPPGFMNFPISNDGLYDYKGYFSHFEAEERTMHEDKDGNFSFVWKKKKSNMQNHFFDCKVYNFALKEIIMKKVCLENGIKEYNWNIFSNIILGK